MPYEERNSTSDCARPAREQYEFQGPRGLKAGVSHLRMRDQWSAWTYDPALMRSYEHTIHDTFDAALDALRLRAPWADLSDAR